MVTREEFDEIFYKDNSSLWTGDNALKGLLIMQKYFDDDKTLIVGAGHEKIHFVEVDELIDAGITIDDVIELRSLNWMIDDGMFMACFV